LLKAQETGSVPPQESALLYNSWTGKHHNEMRYWHQTWLPIWGHPELLVCLPCMLSAEAGRGGAVWSGSEDLEHEH
jgi:hypothetical protein